MNGKFLQSVGGVGSGADRGAVYYYVLLAIIVAFVIYSLASVEPVENPELGEGPVPNESNAFGLELDPQGPGADEWNSPDSDLLHAGDVGPIPLTNEWHHVKRYNRSIGAFEGPVYVIVLADNVHHANAPDPAAHESVDQPLNWTDSPPEEMVIGNNSYNITNGELDPVPESSSTGEPTNDIYMLFEPGCEESSLQFVSESAGYNNSVYMNTEDGRETIVEDTNDPDVQDQVFDAPGVACDEDGEWRR